MRRTTPLHRRLRSLLRRSLAGSGAFEGVRRALVGVSGGADSAALLHLLADLSREGGPELVAVHVHHRLRGQEADRDAAVAEKLARAHGCEFHVTYLRPRPGGWKAEHRLRQARLAALEKCARELDAERVVLGHQMDDQAETFLLRLLAGADLRGLAGIRPFRPPLWVHPMLQARRSELRREAERCGLPFAEDSSNEETRYRRNYLRKKVLPLLAREFNPRLEPHLAELAESFARTFDHLETEAKEVLRRAAVCDGTYRLGRLREAPAPVRHVALQRLFRQWTGEGAALSRKQMGHVDRLIRGGSPGATLSMPRRVSIRRGRGTLELQKSR